MNISWVIKILVALGVLVSLVGLEVGGVVYADPATQISYQGRLRSRDSGQLENGNKTMQFIIYGATGSWDSGAMTVVVRNGLFHVLLDVNLALDFNEAPYELEIVVEGESLGREPLVAVPMAVNSDMLDGHHWDEIMDLFGPDQFIENKYANLTPQEKSSFWIDTLGRIGTQDRHITLGEEGTRISSRGSSLDLNALEGDVTIGLANERFDSGFYVRGNAIFGFDNDSFDNYVIANGRFSTRNGDDGINISEADPHTISAHRDDLTVKSVGRGGFWFGNESALAFLDDEGNLEVKEDISLRDNWLDDGSDGIGIKGNGVVDYTDDANNLDSMDSHDFVWNYTNTGTPQEDVSFNITDDSFIGGDLTIGGNIMANNFPVSWGDTLLYGNEATADLLLERFRIIDVSWIGDEDEGVEVKLWGSSIVDQGAGLDLQSGNGWIDMFGNTYVQGVLQTNRVEATSGDLYFNYPNDRDNVRVGGEGESKRMYVYYSGGWGEVYHTRNFNWNSVILNQNLQKQNPGNFWIGGTGHANILMADDLLQGNQIKGGYLEISGDSLLSGQLEVGEVAEFGDEVKIQGLITGYDSLEIDQDITAQTGTILAQEGNIEAVQGEIIAQENNIIAKIGDIIAEEGEVQAHIVRAKDAGGDDAQFCLEDDCVTAWPRGFWFREEGTDFLFPNDPEDADSRDAAQNWRVSVGSEERPENDRFFQVWQDSGLRIGASGAALDLFLQDGYAKLSSEGQTMSLQHDGDEHVLLAAGGGGVGIGNVEGELDGDERLVVEGDIAWGDGTERSLLQTISEGYRWLTKDGQASIMAAEGTKFQTTSESTYLHLDNDSSNIFGWRVNEEDGENGIFIKEGGKVGIGISDPASSPPGAKSILHVRDEGILVGDTFEITSKYDGSNPLIESHDTDLFLNARKNNNVLIGSEIKDKQGLFVQTGYARVGELGSSNDFLDLKTASGTNIIESASGGGKLQISSLTGTIELLESLSGSRVAVGQDDITLQIGESGQVIDIYDSGKINAITGGTPLIINGESKEDVQIGSDSQNLTISTKSGVWLNSQGGRLKINNDPVKGLYPIQMGSDSQNITIDHFMGHITSTFDPLIFNARSGGAIRVGDTFYVELRSDALGPMIIGRSTDFADKTPLKINPYGGNVHIGTSLKVDPSDDHLEIYEAVVDITGYEELNLKYLKDLKTVDGGLTIHGNLNVSPFSGMAGDIKIAGDFLFQDGWKIDSSSGDIKFVNGGDAKFKVNNGGDLHIDGLYYCSGADLAEMIAGRVRFGRAPESGDVVIVDPLVDEGVTLTNQSYDSRVAGVVSTDPAIIMGQEGGLDETIIVEGEDGLPLALVGRVPVKVSTINGPIKRGDLLVSSTIPGHAMRADQNDLGFGMIIGKAMGELTEGQGMITVLVNLQ